MSDIVDKTTIKFPGGSLTVHAGKWRTAEECLSDPIIEPGDPDAEPWEPWQKEPSRFKRRGIDLNPSLPSKLSEFQKNILSSVIDPEVRKVTFARPRNHHLEFQLQAIAIQQRLWDAIMREYRNGNPGVSNELPQQAE